MNGEESPLALWLHLLSAHACVVDPNLSVAELADIHDHDHAGPCGIRNHPIADRSFELAAVAEALTEMTEPEPVAAPVAEPGKVLVSAADVAVILLSQPPEMSGESWAAYTRLVFAVEAAAGT